MAHSIDLDLLEERCIVDEIRIERSVECAVVNNQILQYLALAYELEEIDLVHRAANRDLVNADEDRAEIGR